MLNQKWGTSVAIQSLVIVMCLSTPAFAGNGPGGCPGCLGDANGSCNVDEADIGMVMGFWLTFVPPGTNGDVSGNGFVDETDMGIVLANWLRVCPRLNPPVANAGGPYNAQCQGAITNVQLDGRASSDPDGDTLTFAWSSDCKDVTFDDPASPTPTLSIPRIACSRACGVTLTVSDGVFPPVSAAVLVTVSDSTAPVITVPADAVRECGSATDPGATGIATANDACEGAVTVTFSDAPVGDALGSLIRTWRAADSCENEATATQRITIQDSTAPTITLPPNATVECGGSTAPAATGNATATDGCGGNVTITFSDAPADGSPSGVTRTWRAVDASGNATTGVQTISVVDTTPPTITCPSNVQVQATSADGVAAGDVPLAAPTASDTCGGAPTITDNRPPTFPVGSTNVTFTVRDASGNAATCTATVVVLPPDTQTGQPAPAPEPTQPVRDYTENRVTTTTTSGLCPASGLGLMLVSLLGATRSHARRGGDARR